MEYLELSDLTLAMSPENATMVIVKEVVMHMHFSGGGRFSVLCVGIGSIV